jgi:hypothetical protein
LFSSHPSFSSANRPQPLSLAHSETFQSAFD